MSSTPFLSFGFILIALFHILPKPPDPSYTNVEKAEKIFLVLEVERTLVYDVTAYLYDDELYLPAKSLFSKLQIKSSYKPFSGLSVYFPETDHPLNLDFRTGKITGSDHYSASLHSKEILLTKNDAYIRKDLLQTLFQFRLLYSYRELKVALFSKESLPVLQNYIRKQRYKYFNETYSSSSDQYIPGKHYLLSGWTAQWNIYSSHNLYNQDYSYGLGMGGSILGGDLSLYGTGSKDYAINTDQIRGQWKYPIYSTPLIRQITLGNLSHQDLLGGGSLPYEGIEINNQVLAPRQLFDDYTLSGRLNEGWDSEFYVNQHLVDFATSTHDRNFRFSSPLHYGSNHIQLKRYSPDGEIFPQNYLIYVPREFLPPGKFEYSFSAGHYTNFIDQNFALANATWGLSSFLTIGGGAQYMRRENKKQTIPFAQSWLRVGNHIVVNGSYSYKYLSHGSLRIMFNNAQSVLLDLKKFDHSSLYNKTKRSLEASINSSFPVHLFSLDFNSYLSSRFIQYYSSDRYLNMYGGIFVNLPLELRLNLNSRIMTRDVPTRGVQINQLKTQVNLSKRIARFLLSPELEYDYTYNCFSQAGMEMSTRLFRNGYLNASLHWNNIIHQIEGQISFQLDLPFARHTSFIRSHGSNPTYNQSTSGTIVFNSHNRNLLFDDQSLLMKSSLTLNPYLDLNNNSLKDKGEPLIENVGATIYEPGSYAPIYINKKRAFNLKAYGKYIIHINTDRISNPLWVPKRKKMLVRLSPNNFNTIDVPFTVTGELLGEVALPNKTSDNSLENLNIRIESTDGEFDKQVTTYSKGKFDLVGLKPGTYVASLDKKQLGNRSLIILEDSVKFTVKSLREGDFINDLTLKVDYKRKTKDQSPNYIVVIQIGAFSIRKNAEKLAKLTESIVDENVQIIFDRTQHLYKCRIGYYKTKDRAYEALYRLQQKERKLFKDAFIVKYRYKN